MKRLALLLVLAVWAIGAQARAMSCTPVANDIPAFPGRMVYEDFAAGQIYLYDLNGATSCTHFARIPIETWGLSSATNPVFSPDGQAVVFTAVQTEPTYGAEHHIFYWVIGAETVTNLTVFLDQTIPGGTRNEDAKFTVGQTQIQMVWKETGGVRVADFGLDSFGGPVLSNTQKLVPGSRGTWNEDSAPTFSPDANHIYFFQGSSSAPPITLQVTPGSGMLYSPLFNGQAGRRPPPRYYPITDFVGGKLFYVAGPNGGREGIYTYPNANAVNPEASRRAPGAATRPARTTPIPGRSTATTSSSRATKTPTGTPTTSSISASCPPACRGRWDR